MTRVLDTCPIDDVLARAGGRRGATKLKTLLSSMQFETATTTTRSELEELFLQICRDAGRPPEGVNAWIAFPAGGGAEADFVWREQKLVIEVDGRAVHTTATPSSTTAEETSA